MARCAIHRPCLYLYGGFSFWRSLLRTLTQADLDTIAQELNERPRQTLGFKTRSQALAEVLR